MMRMVKVFFRSCVVLGVLLVNGQNVFAGESVSVQKYKIPSYKGNYKKSGFSGIGIDGRTRKISMAQLGGWFETVHSQGIPQFNNSFMAPTKGYDLTAVAGGSDGTYVYDRVSQTIMSDGGKYRIKGEFNNVTGLAFHQGYIYLAQGKKIYKLELSGHQAKILEDFSVSKTILGLTSDGQSLWGCDVRTLVHFDSSNNIDEDYELNVAIDGLAWIEGGVFVAPGKGSNIIYRINIQ